MQHVAIPLLPHSHTLQSKRARERAEAKKRELEEDKRLARDRTRAEEEVAE